MWGKVITPLMCYIYHALNSIENLLVTRDVDWLQLLPNVKSRFVYKMSERTL